MSESTFYPDLRTYVRESKVDAEIIDLHTPMKTAQAAAEQLRVTVAQIIKSILLVYRKTKKQKEYVLVVLSGDTSVDLQKLADLKEWNKNKISFSSSDTVLQRTGFPAGGTPPIGHKERLPVLWISGYLIWKLGMPGVGNQNFF